MFIRVKTKPGNPEESVKIGESVREGRRSDQCIVSRRCTVRILKYAGRSNGCSKNLHGTSD